MEYCLGVNILGYCNDYVNNQLSVFNIGAFLSFVGVIFAGYQLTNNIHKIRFNIRYNLFLIILSIIPFLTIIISVLLSFIPGKALPLIGYSIFREIITSLYILFTGFYFIYFIFLRKISSFENKGGKINKIYVNYTARNRDIDALVSELGYFFKDFLKKYKEELETRTWGSSHQFLMILQNQRIIDNIISNPITLQSIIISYLEDKRTQFSYYEQRFLSKVILGSFANNDSFLVHELDGNFDISFKNHNGIILKNIIENLDFLERLNILGESNTFFYSDNIIFAKNCLKFIEKIHDEFLNKERLPHNYEKHDLLLNVFKTQSGIIQRSFRNFDNLSKINLLGFNFHHNLQELHTHLIALYPENKYPEILLNEQKPYGSPYHYHDSNISILDAYAFGFFELLESFSQFKDIDIRHYTLDFSSNLQDGELFKEIEKRLFILYKHKIKENLRGYYPMVSRVFWENYSRTIINKVDEANESSDLIGILKLYAEMLPKLSEGHIYAYTNETLQDPYMKDKAIEKSKKFINDLFPEYIDYNKESNSLYIYGMDRLSFTTLNLGKTLTTGKIEIE